MFEAMKKYLYIRRLRHPTKAIVAIRLYRNKSLFADDGFDCSKGRNDFMIACPLDKEEFTSYLLALNFLNMGSSDKLYPSVCGAHE